MTTESSQPMSGLASNTESRRARPERILILDPLRGLAACAVMWFHFTNGGALFAGEDALSQWLQASGSKGWLGVEVFFVLSGFIIPYAMWRGKYRLGDYPTFLLKRILRLEPPYLVTLLLILGLWAAGSLVPGFAGEPFAFQFERFFVHLGYLNAFFDHPWYNPVFWTLAVEFQFYLAIALLFPLVRHRRAAVRAGLPVALAALALAGAGSELVIHHLPLFALGIAAAQRFLGLLSRRVFLAVFCAVALLGYATLGLLPAVVGASTTVGILTLSGLPAESRPGGFLSARPLVWLGTISYSLYLLHVTIGGRIVNLGARFSDGFAGDVLVALAAVAGSLAAAYLLHRFVERPTQRLASSIGYGKRGGLRLVRKKGEDAARRAA